LLLLFNANQKKPASSRIVHYFGAFTINGKQECQDNVNCGTEPATGAYHHWTDWGKGGGPSQFFAKPGSIFLVVLPLKSANVQDVWLHPLPVTLL
jgi:hypothetical protein